MDERRGVTYEGVASTLGDRRLLIPWVWSGDACVCLAVDGQQGTAVTLDLYEEEVRLLRDLLSALLVLRDRDEGKVD